MRGPRVAIVAFFIAMAVVHAIIAFWTPLQGDDWSHWVWAARHHDAGMGSWLAAHFTMSDAVGYLLARSTAIRVIVSPAVGVALVVGLFVVAMRRLPAASWSDALGLVVISALIWIAQPHAGVTWFHTPSIAMHIYGVAVALWFIAPLRCGWQVPRALWPVIAIAGYCVGTSTRAIATATLVGFVLAIGALPRDRRARWMWFAFGGLLIGVVAGYLKAPWIEFGRVFRRGFEPNLLLMNQPIQETGRLISLVLVFVLADLGLGAVGRGRASGDALPNAGDSLRWLVAWIATAVWCLFGPRAYHATFLPATCMLVIAAVPYVLWLAQSPALRYAIVVFAIGVHAIVWPIALVEYHQRGVQGAMRMATLEKAKPGSVAHVAPYPQILPTFWLAGEDLNAVHQRQSVAVEVFGLRDVVFEPSFRHMEIDPGIQVKLETDGVSDAELRAASPPARWSTTPSVAREQFELFVQRLRSVTGKPSIARLVVTNVTLDNRGSRPLLAAWADATGTIIPRTAISPMDEINEFTVRIYGANVPHFNEAWIVDDGVARSTPYRNGSPRLHPTKARLNVVIVCNSDRCLVADAFVPRF